MVSTSELISALNNLADVLSTEHRHESASLCFAAASRLKAFDTLVKLASNFDRAHLADTKPLFDAVLEKDE